MKPREAATQPENRPPTRELCSQRGPKYLFFEVGVLPSKEYQHQVIEAVFGPLVETRFQLNNQGHVVVHLATTYAQTLGIDQRIFDPTISQEEAEALVQEAEEQGLWDHLAEMNLSRQLCLFDWEWLKAEGKARLVPSCKPEAARLFPAEFVRSKETLHFHPDNYPVEVFKDYPDDPAVLHIPLVG